MRLGLICPQKLTGSLQNILFPHDIPAGAKARPDLGAFLDTDTHVMDHRVRIAIFNIEDTPCRWNN